MVKHGLAFRTERRDDHRRTGPDVGHLQVGPPEPAGTVDCLGSPVQALDPGAHLHQLGHVLEAVLEDVLGDDAQALRLRHQRHVLRLEVGRKTRVNPGRQVDRPQRRAARPADADLELADVDLDSSLLELDHWDVQVSRRAALEDDLAPGRRHRDGVRAGFQVVRADAVLAPVKSLHPLHHDLVGTGPCDLRAEAVEKEGEVLDVRLAGGVQDLGPAFREDGGHHQVLGAGHRRHVQHDPGTVQPIRAGDELLRSFLDHGAQPPQPPDMLLDPARADVIAARPGQAHLAAASQERTQEDERGAHLAGKFR